MTTIISLTILGILVLFLGIMKKTSWLLPLILTGLPVTLLLTFRSWDHTGAGAPGMLVTDRLSVAFTLVMTFSTFLIFTLAGRYYRGVKRSLDDIYAVMIFALAGAVMMTSYANLILLFLGVETLSIALYVLAGSHKEAITSNEATLKYFLLGSFLSGFLLFGIALLYGSSGSFELERIGEFVHRCQGNYPPMFLAGLFLLLIGLAFKIAIVPFHFWAPDVYEGTPTLLTAFMATVVKTAAITALYRFYVTVFPGIHGIWDTTLAVMAALTILLGNLTGVYQPGLKRMLAYSGISHSGYMMLAMIAFTPTTAGSLLLYTLSYSVATILAFAVLITVRETHGNDRFESMNGMARKSPAEAFSLTVAMFSLTGIPPLAGFMAKYYLFSTALSGGWIWLVVIALAGSAVSAAYYFRPVIAMYLKEPGEASIRPETPYRVRLIFMALLVILLGLAPVIVTGVL